MTLLQQFESTLATAADSALMNVGPTGGFAAFLQKNPGVATLFSIAILTAHTYLSGLETKLTPPAPVVPEPPAEPPA